MTEVGAADLSRLLHSKRNEYNAIVTSRKRKLRELFAVATHAESLPRDGFTNPDATEPSPAESQFLQANDILQDKLFDDATLPKRSEPNVGFFVQSLHNVLFPPAELQPVPHAVATKIDAPLASQAIKQPAAVVPNVRQGPAATAGRLTPASSVSSPLSAPVDPKSSSASPVSSGLNVTTPSIAPNREARPSPSVTPAAAKLDVKAKQTAQVSFLPGTKGSPSTTSPQAVPNPTASETNGVAVLEMSGRVARGVTLPEAVKANDAVSSPGSTAASVATPHVQTASTDTSPDKEAPPKLEPTQEPRQLAHSDEKQPSVSRNSPEVDNANSMVVDSAEEQLLQESRRSVQAATPRASSGEPVKPAAAIISATSASTVSNASEKATPKPEVPDSQEDVSDKMEIDGAPQTATTPMATETPQEHKPSTSATSVASQTPQSPPKDTTHVTERAVTRVSSGAMRLKSVNEIVGGTPKATLPADPATIQDLDNQLTPLTSTSQSPSSKYRHGRPQSRGQVSTVLFGKHPKRSEEKSVAPDEKEIIKPEDDYFTPLFVQGFTNSSSWMQPMEKLLYQANKTIATPDALLALQDHQACKVLRRVYHLQQNDKWSLRQPKRCPEPTRQASQWDVLIKEVKWMRTDFREERKWKMALARNLAYACAEWHAASPEIRKEMQIPAHIPPKAQTVADVSMVDADEDGPESQPTPDLVSSADSPQNIEELSDDFIETVAPSAIFALQEDDLVFGLRRSPTADRLLDELPMYSSPLQVPKVDPLNPEFDPDALWKRPALPLSKYVEGQMKVIAPVPPRKRSRYEYEDDSSDDEVETLFPVDGHVHHVRLPPASDAVSLFKPEMKHTRDRLHAGHQFRPPSEHPMPVQSFYECRSPSQWTQSEDDELRSLVREYTYNWPLISGMLSSRSQFTSGAERRTPWECFERWINLEGLPADMSKTQYFKAYNSRIEAAQRVIMQQNQLAAQQASASGNNTTPLRRRPSVPLRVERRRNQKHLTLIDAMRKLAKKRETQQQKQQQTAAQSAANKKPIDTSNQRLPTKTPRDYSLLRWERDQALAERMAQYAAKQDAQRRAAMQAARGQGQASQAAAGQVQGGQGGVPAAQQVNHAGAVNGANGVQRSNIPNHVAVAAAAVAAQQQGRPRMPLQAPVNGMANGNGVQAHMNGALAAPVAHMTGQPQMQAALQAQQQQLSQQQRVQMPTSQAELMMRAQRMAEQQRNAIQMQQQQHAQQHPQHQQTMQQQQQQHQAQAQQNNVGTPGSQGTQGSPPMRNGVANMNQQNFMNNAQNILAQYGANGGHGTPKSGLHMPSLAAGSPGQAQARPQPQFPNNISAQLAQLEANFLAKNPSLTPEQTRQLATEHLTRAMMQQRQSAMNAAAGGAAAAALANAQPGITNGMTATTSPHQYAALLRQQQQQQQASQAAQSASPVPQAQQIAHQRQSSEGSTPSGPK